jgi:hypothetical protein
LTTGGVETIQRIAAGEFLRAKGMPDDDLRSLPASEKRFPDGAHYRIEIPTMEGPGCLEAVLEHADALDVPVHRVSQDSGLFEQTDDELDETARLAADAGVEVSLFASGGAWALSEATRQQPRYAVPARGQAQLAANLEDCLRAADHGFRSVIIADVGVLAAFGEARSAGVLPADMQAKISAMLPAANAAAVRVFERLGASTINLPRDLTLPQIAAIRAAADVPLDVYIETGDSVSGFVRHHDLAKLIRVAAPVYVKFGRGNIPPADPQDAEAEGRNIELARLLVRRARLGLEVLKRSSASFAPATSEPGAAGIAVPVAVPR